MQITYWNSESTNPYENLALEEFLLRNTDEDECILYLWQNYKTTVIGYNQNAWKECKVEELRNEGGHIARRLSGGGAVFHDLGNLNFTFLTRKKNYSVEKQTEVILRAANLFGIPAERTGRNDITVDGKKFSGNAFYQSGDFYYHHGTLLVDVDKGMMSRYLNASVKKLQSKGVDSVRSRVCNLNEYNKEVTISSMKDVLLQAYGEVYGGIPKEMEASRIDQVEIQKSIERLSSWEWIFGREIAFNTQWDHRFPWGEVQLQLSIQKGRIEDILVWTDAMEVGIAKKLEYLWKDTCLSPEEMRLALNKEDIYGSGEYNLMLEVLERFSAENNI